MRKPKPLKAGDTIRFVSPASPLAPEKVDNMVRLLQAEGYNVQIAQHAFERNGFLAGTDAQRIQDLEDAFADPQVQAVFCTRGGYGCSRIVQALGIDKIAASGKVFVGFSDTTVLQLALMRRNAGSIYGPMGSSFSKDREPWVYESFKHAINGGNPIPDSAPKGVCLVPGRVSGVLTGGCLSLLCDSIGTSYALDARERVLLIEDVDERPHRIDAMLTHLLNTGILQSAAGIVVGEMTGTDAKFDDSTGQGSWRDIVRERIAPLGIPTIIDLPCGHATNMLSLPLGLKVRLDADAGSLEYLETL